MHAFLQPLRIRGFGRLALSYAFNELGDWLATIALSVLVFDETHSALATTALFVSARFLPGFVVPIAATRLDGFPVTRALAGLYVAEAIAFAALAVTSTAFLLPVVLALALVVGTIAAAARAATRTATVALLESAGRLREGNAILNLGFSAMSASGPAIAGLLVAAAGVSATLAVGAGVLLVQAVAAGTVPVAARTEREPAPWQSRVREALDYVLADPQRRTLLIGQAFVLLMLSIVTPIEVVYAKESLDAGDTGFGIFLASWGAGMVAGSWLFAHERHRSLMSLVVLSTFAMALGYLGMAVAPTLAVACTASFFGGLGNGVQWVAVVTSLQEATEDAFQARVAGLLEAVITVAPGAGFLVGGLITTLISPRAAFAVSGAGVLLLMLVAGLALGHRRRHAPPEPLAEPPAEPARELVG